MDALPPLFLPIVRIMAFFVLFCALLYSIVLAYHWYTFGTSKQTSNRALTIYGIGFAILAITIIGLTLNLT